MQCAPAPCASCRACAGAGDHDAALRWYSRALAVLSPALPEAGAATAALLLGRATAAAAAGDESSALADARSAVGADPRSPSAHAALGAAFERAHSLQEAAAAYCAGLQACPRHPELEAGFARSIEGLRSGWRHYAPTFGFASMGVPPPADVAPASSPVTLGSPRMDASVEPAAACSDDDVVDALRDAGAACSLEDIVSAEDAVARVRAYRTPCVVCVKLCVVRARVNNEFHLVSE